MVQDKSLLAVHYGENIFSFELMKQRISREFFDKLMFAIRNNRAISPETADVIAQAMKEWAIARGATHFTHWFQPLTGLTAEKHDSFLTFDENGKIIERFSGKQLIMSEPDASSFPHGGLRSTFEARGYATWDPSSPAFLIRRGDKATLCLPSVFVSHKGEVLDKKAPLLRSVTAVSQASVRMLRLLGNKRVTAVTPYVGAEQEYFLIDRELFQQRLDLGQLGNAVIGAAPAKGQQLEDHYFRAIPNTVLDFMEDLEHELVRLGIPVKTRHNEVAPAQYELAVLHLPVNIAADHNQLVMEMIRRVAPLHGFEALLHEKPFAGVNGSGKHNNWSLIDSEGTNMFEPGSSLSARMRFLLFTTAVVWAVRRHGSLLGAIAASPGNDLRLGGNEAPPAIMSVHLGHQLSNLLQELTGAGIEGETTQGEIDLGLAGVAKIPRDTTDRNRTSPFCFTGNKFEFRALGSSAAISLPNVAINAMVAESLDDMSDRLEQRLEAGLDRNAAVVEVIKEVYQEAADCVFDGDNYSEEWVSEAERRGLFISRSTAQSLEALSEPSSVQLFENYGVMTGQEVAARYRIKMELYVRTVTVELNVARQMIATQVLPAALNHQQKMADSILKAKELVGNDGVRHQLALINELAALNEKLVAALRDLEELGGRLDEQEDLRAEGLFCAGTVRPGIASARKVADRLEQLVDACEWKIPRFDDMLTI